MQSSRFYYQLMFATFLIPLASCGSSSHPASANASTGTSSTAAVTQDSNNGPVYAGVFFQDTNQLYLSSQPISCDSNALQPNQTILRLDFTSDIQGGNYNIVTDFYTNPGKDTVPVATKMQMGFDASCQSITNPNDATAWPAFDVINLKSVDAKSGAPSGRLLMGSGLVNVAQFTSVGCPAGSVNPYLPTWNTHCALGEYCDPIALTCVAPVEQNSTTAANANNGPVYTGVFFQDSNQLYLSSQPISCDSNVLQPNQTILRLDFTSDMQGGNYNIVTDFYTNPGKDTVPVATKMQMGFDASCQSITDPNDATAWPAFDVVNLAAVDAKSGAPSGRLLMGSGSANIAQFTSVACPAGSVNPYLPTWNTHCALPESCDPIALTCAAAQ